jgi:hypothetical protein
MESGLAAHGKDLTMRTLLVVTAAFAALVIVAPLGAHAGDTFVEPHQNVIDECPLNDSGETLLKGALMTTSRARLISACTSWDSAITNS